MTSEARKEPEWQLDLDGATITEDLVARLFVEHYKGRLVFCHSRGKWYEFDDYTWIMHDTPLAFHQARELCRKVSMRSASPGQIQKVRFAAGVETFAKSDPIMARTDKNWNRDPFLLGTPKGTVDLRLIIEGDARRGGELRDSKPTDYINRCTAVEPDEFEDCPTWHRFLDEATGGDVGLQRFLQQIAGYCLTGDTSEQCLFFIHGDGGRGKGVFLSAIRGIMGDYAATAAMETFEAKSLSHTTSIAELTGSRMVTASETEEGRAWAEARIKLFTGEDPLTARFMRQDNFTFMPQFKVVIIGNHQPTLNTVDDAMKRRFNMIPFTRLPKKKDKSLSKKLKKEWPAILRWAINGCLDWQEHGLIRPESVLQSTAEYFADQDVVGQWLAEFCDVDPARGSGMETATTLFASWAKFAKANGEDAGSQKTFGQTLNRLQFPKKRTAGGMWYRGIRLKDFREGETEAFR